MSTRRLNWNINLLAGSLLGSLILLAVPAAAQVVPSAKPLFLGDNGTPLSLLVMGRDHKLYYEAYNDASDLNQDGTLDVGYKPLSIDYYGYFDSHKCYTHTTSTGTGQFTPASVTANKKCSSQWSGDFLNYLTMSRMDALRKVLYGGYRSTDSSTATVLRRALIPQDAHSWGKEYTSTTVDGFDISEYSPLSQPAAGTRHLFANTTLYNGTSSFTTLTTAGDPLLRVLTNSQFRVWQWLSIERPVAGDQCVSGINSSGVEIRTNCVVAGGTISEIVPSEIFLSLTQTTYSTAAASSPVTPTAAYGTYPNSHADYDTLVANYANSTRRIGSGNVSSINGSGNPFSAQQDNYLTIFSGQIMVPTTGTYTFAVDGDDAVEVIINGTVVAGWYGGHGSCSCGTHSGTITLTGGVAYPIVFRHQESTGGDNYYLRWEKTVPASVRTDYGVRVEVCKGLATSSPMLLEPECKGYPANNPTVYKPTGLLHDFGETDKMAFGLLTGSYAKHLSGGVLRKNIASFKNEINTTTGQFITPTSGGSIEQTIDRLAVIGFDYGSYSYTDGSCGVPMVTPMQEGRCAMWGNPVAEMMYEGLRYFAGKTGPTTAYDYTSGYDDSSSGHLNLPKPTWKNPYRDPTSATDPGYVWCSKPFEVVIADVNTFDSDQLPNTAFTGTTANPNPPNASQTLGTDTLNINVTTLAQTIWNGEVAENDADKPTSPSFVGESLANATTNDNAPTAKTVDSFGNIRGLSPEEPTRQGGYYAGSVAFYGRTNDLNSVQGDQKTDTFSVALSSPLPRMAMPITVNGTTKTVTLVPFAKTVGGCLSSSYIPTNTIVDFYVETIANTGTGNQNSTINSGRAYAKFRINYEDSEYGSDHDMDAIVRYELYDDGAGHLQVNLASDYAAGGCKQHMGYVISGTTADGVYLEVRDTDTGATNDSSYALDTPPGSPPAPGNVLRTSSPYLDLNASRTFTPGATPTAAYIPHEPLWYAAKWGGFVENDKDPTCNSAINGTPDQTCEWDKDNNKTPDNYFLVTNAGNLKNQLELAFKAIIAKIGSAASVAVNTGSLQEASLIYQASFNSLDWSGNLKAFRLDSAGQPISQAWEAGQALSAQNFNTGRAIITYNPTQGQGVAFRWPSNPSSPGATDLSLEQVNALKGVTAPINTDTYGQARLNYLRGDTSNEGQNGLKFRDRGMTTPLLPNGSPGTPYHNVLGDIVDSNPIFVGVPRFLYVDSPNFPGYSTFRQTYQNRKPVIYAGANDGMLHGFDASFTVDSNGVPQPTLTSGKEVIAYVPSMVFRDSSKLLSDTISTSETLPLIALTTPGYNHQFYVDGSPTVGDVLFGGNWHTVLVGGLRGGGKGIYALDVTNPSQLTEGNAQNLVLWERAKKDYGSTAGNFSDLGFTFGQLSIVRLHNGQWATIFGNGYGGAKAVFYIVDIQTGNIIVKFDTSSTSQCAGAFTTAVSSNGLSTPTAIDSNGDFIVDLIYAGDLQGNLWRFDVTSGSSTGWTCSRLVTATDSSGNRQPITTAPEVTRHPLKSTSNNDSFIVLFGTGKYLETADVNNASVQAFFGVWDNDGALITNGRADLQQQDFFAQTFAADGSTFFLSTSNTVNYSDTSDLTANPLKKGWFIDLTKATGERMVGDPLLVGSRIAFTSIVPSADACTYGGSSFLNVLDAVNGSRADVSFLSRNTSTYGQPINSPTSATSLPADLQGVAASSVQVAGIATGPTALGSSSTQSSIVYMSSSTVTTTSAGDTFIGSVFEIRNEDLGRQSWRQILGF